MDWLFLILTREWTETKNGNVKTCIMLSLDPEQVYIPKPFQKLFPATFNMVQKESYHDIWNTEKNLIVQAPTGSGKTVVAKMALLKGLLKPQKVMYVGPLRALNDEKGQEFQELTEYNWIVKTILGGTYYSATELKEADVVLTTPEKLQSLLYTMDLNQFSVIVIDEIHLLGEQKRGAYLEFILLELMQKYPLIRIVGLSATIPNSQELASWLQATLLSYGQEHRSTILDVKVFAVDNNNSKIGNVLKGYQIVKRFLPEQLLLFTTSRGQVVYYAKKIEEWSVRDGIEQTEQILYANRRLTELSRHGIAFYHAGLIEEDKKNILKNYAEEKIKILISTSSLAWGVNLPAKAVIILDTEYANPLTGKEPMSSADLLQMLGRAGRPQYHTKGYGYILTKEANKQKMENMLEGKVPITSSMLDYLTEIVLHYLSLEKAKNLPKEELMKFFKKTFLVESNYMNEEELENELEIKLVNLQTLNLLEVKNDLLSITQYGTLTSRFFIHPGTAGNLIHAKPNDCPEEMIPLVLEFKELPVRRNEKKFLRSLGATPKTYRDYKLQYVIGKMERKERLEPEFIQDGNILYKEYVRIQSFYNYLKKIQ